MPEFQVNWSDNLDKSIPTVKIKVSGDQGIVLDEYEMSFSDFSEAIIDSELRNLRPQTIIGHRKTNHPKSIVGWKKINNPNIRVETPLMAGNWIKHIYFRDSKDHLVVCELPKNQWDLYYYNTPFEVVGHPRMIFAYKIAASGKIIAMYCFAVKDGKRLKADTELYKYPYANVKAGTGLICMGLNNIPSVKELSQCLTMHNLFFGSPSSNCYYHNRNLSGVSELRELYHSMQKQDFPEDWLISEKITLEEFFNRF